MPGTGLPCCGTQCRKAAVTFHVPEFTVSDSGGLVGKGTNAPLQHVWDAYAIGEAHQSPPDGKIRPEYTDEIEDTGCGDSGKLYRGNLQPHGG